MPYRLYEGKKVCTIVHCDSNEFEQINLRQIKLDNYDTSPIYMHRKVQQSRGYNYRKIDERALKYANRRKRIKKQKAS